MQGVDSTLIQYGQTGSGKTYTTKKIITLFLENLFTSSDSPISVNFSACQVILALLLELLQALCKLVWPVMSVPVTAEAPLLNIAWPTATSIPNAVHHCCQTSFLIFSDCEHGKRAWLSSRITGLALRTQ